MTQQFDCDENQSLPLKLQAGSVVRRLLAKRRVKFDRHGLGASVLKEDGNNVSQGVQYLIEVREHVMKAIFHAVVSRVMEEILEVLKLIPQPLERVQNCDGTERGTLLFLRFNSKLWMTWRSSIRHNRLQHRTVERIVDVPMSRSTEETSDVVQIIPQKCVSKRIGDDEKFVLILNADDKRDEIGEKKKKFSTSKDMGMHLTCGGKEHSNHLSEGGLGGLVRNAGSRLRGSQLPSDWLISQSGGRFDVRTLNRAGEKHENSDIPEQEAGWNNGAGWHANS